MDFRVVIMAGGSGTRFWPLSREKRPKQLLPIISEKTMIEETVERLLPLVPLSRIYTIANRELTQSIRSLLPHLPEANFLIEPQGKNTAPSLILATARIFLQNPEAVVAAVPADHLIKDPPYFLKKFEAGAMAASEAEHLVTFGIPPSYPATGYGYIQFLREGPLPIKGENFYAVQKFREKPDQETAKSFLAQGNYYWNSGMFIWKASVFAWKLEQHAPEMHTYWERMIDALKEDDEAQIKVIFEEIPAISIDYALMEKAKGVLMGEGNFGWSDVGSWSSLAEVWPQDSNNNALIGESVVLDAKGSLVYAPSKLTALVGVDDLIVIDTKDALLICRKDQDQRVKEVVELLKKRGKKDYL